MAYKKPFFPGKFHTIKTYLCLGVFFSFLLLSSCARRKVNKNLQLKEKFMLTEQLEAKSLYDNKVMASVKQKINVLLPPSYNDGKKKYPVVYYLHSFGGSYMEMEFFTDILSKAMKKNRQQEFIVVGVNGHTSLGGSFFVNSIVSGNWEDHLLKEVLPFVEKNYRCSGKQGIAGFSMGGFAALKIAFEQPDVFDGLYALSPMILNNAEADSIFKSWDESWQMPYGAAFSPAPSQEFPFAGIPTFDNSKEDSLLLVKWKEGIGNWEQKVTAYQSKNKLLKGIYFEYGKEDDFAWIPNACAHLSEILKEADIPHKVSPLEDGQAQNLEERIEQSMLPFFEEVFR